MLRRLAGGCHGDAGQNGGQHPVAALQERHVPALLGGVGGGAGDAGASRRRRAARTLLRHEGGTARLPGGQEPRQQGVREGGARNLDQEAHGAGHVRTQLITRGQCVNPGAGLVAWNVLWIQNGAVTSLRNGVVRDASEMP